MNRNILIGILGLVLGFFAGYKNLLDLKAGGGSIDKPVGEYYATGVTGGGTGLTEVATNALIIGQGTSAMIESNVGTSGQMCVASSAGVPTFVTMSGDGTLSDTGVLTVTGVTGLTVPDGGTGAVTFATDGLLFGNGTNPIQVTAAGTAGEICMANASAVPEFLTMSGGATIDSSAVIDIGGFDETGSCSSFEGNQVAIGTAGCSLAGHKLEIIATGSIGGLNIDQIAQFPGAVGLDLVTDINGNSDVNVIRSTFALTGLAPGGLAASYLNIVDTANATGGQYSTVNTIKVGVGTAMVAGAFNGPGVLPIVQAVAGGVTFDTALSEDSSVFTDRTAAFASAVTNVQLFNADDDRIYFGAANNTDFGFLTLVLNIASSATITPIFEYSDGAAGWTTFVPNDGTLGFTVDGNIAWDPANLTGWGLNTVDGVSKYWIRIQRTRNALSTPPTEETIIGEGAFLGQWNDEGDISIPGHLQLTKPHVSLDTCDALAIGQIDMYESGTTQSMCVCQKTGASTWAWAAVAGGTCP